MNNKEQKGKSLFSSRKFKYGTVAIVFTVVVCVFLVLLNAVLTIYSDSVGGIFFDFTSENVYELSPESMEVAQKIDKKVDIIFCVTEDRIDDYVIYDIGELSYVKRLAEKYSNVNKNISVKYKNYVADPTYFEQFKSKGNTITNTSVIIYCEETKEYVVYSLANFFKRSSETGNVFAYDGENKITSALMQTALSKDKKVGIISGHGESRRQYFEELLAEQGYSISLVDLTSISEDELNTYNLLLILDPVMDYGGYTAASTIGGVNEIEKLDRYLKNNFGNLMVFVNPDTPELAELNGYLRDTWGVSYSSGEVIVEGLSASMPGYQGVVFYGTPSVDGGYGNNIHAKVTESGINRTLFFNATPVYTHKNENVDVSMVYTTSGDSTVIKGEVSEAAPKIPLMTLSKYEKTIDSVNYASNVIMCGSSTFLDLIGMPSGNANADIIKGALVEMGDDSVVTGIDYKVVEDSALTVSTEDFTMQILKLSAIIPLAIAIIGIIVYIHRKKS